MGIHFDPKTGKMPPQTLGNKLDDTALDNTVIDEFNEAPQEPRSALQALFSGLKQAKAQSENNPTEPIVIPSEADILGATPVLGRGGGTLQRVMNRYIVLRRNLLDRRHNYTQALEGKLQTEEAMDIHKRMGEIDDALFKIEMNLDRLRSRKNLLEARQQNLQWEERRDRLTARLEAGEINQEEFERLMAS